MYVWNKAVKADKDIARVYGSMRLSIPMRCEMIHNMIVHLSGHVPVHMYSLTIAAMIWCQKKIASSCQKAEHQCEKTRCRGKRKVFMVFWTTSMQTSVHLKGVKRMRSNCWVWSSTTVLFSYFNRAFNFLNCQKLRVQNVCTQQSSKRDSLGVSQTNCKLACGLEPITYH